MNATNYRAGRCLTPSLSPLPPHSGHLEGRTFGLPLLYVPSGPYFVPVPRHSSHETFAGTSTLTAFFVFIPKDAGAFPAKRTGPHQRSPVSPFLDHKRHQRSQRLMMLRTQSQAATSVISPGSFFLAYLPRWLLAGGVRCPYRQHGKAVGVGREHCRDPSTKGPPRRATFFALGKAKPSAPRWRPPA
jgi:hypothetical protein